MTFISDMDYSNEERVNDILPEGKFAHLSHLYDVSPVCISIDFTNYFEQF